MDKTEALQNEAFNFKSRSTQLASAMWWRKVKTYVIIFFIVALIIFFITWFACGAKFQKC